MERNTAERTMRQKKTQEHNLKKIVSKLGWFTSKIYTAISPPREDEPVGTRKRRNKSALKKTELVHSLT